MQEGRKGEDIRSCVGAYNPSPVFSCIHAFLIENFFAFLAVRDGVVEERSKAS
jgi:hypothetical protein